jgi:hypothetical protein
MESSFEVRCLFKVFLSFPCSTSLPPFIVRVNQCRMCNLLRLPPLSLSKHEARTRNSSQRGREKRRFEGNSQQIYGQQHHPSPSLPPSMHRHSPPSSPRRRLPIHLPQPPSARRRRSETNPAHEQRQRDRDGEEDAGEKGGDDTGEAREGGGETGGCTAVGGGRVRREMEKGEGELTDRREVGKAAGVRE